MVVVNVGLSLSLGNLIYTLIDKRVTAFNYSIVAKGVGKDGTISKQDFWKIKKVLTPRSFNVPYCVVDSFGNEITDENSIRQEYKNEFSFRLRKRSIAEELKDYEKLNNLLCGQSCITPKGILALISPWKRWK